jgi:hypothetical protein
MQIKRAHVVKKTWAVSFKGYFADEEVLKKKTP